jgi:hypothetical protein
LELPAAANRNNWLPLVEVIVNGRAAAEADTARLEAFGSSVKSRRMAMTRPQKWRLLTRSQRVDAIA